VLNHDVRLSNFVEVAACVQVHWSRVDAGVRLEERHSDAVEIAIDESPEASVRVAVFRTDARMQHERADTRHLQNLGLQDELAARNHQIGSSLFEELARVITIGTVDHDSRNPIELHWIALPELAHCARFPGGIPSGQPQPREDSERHDVEKPPHSDASNLPSRGPPEPPASVTDDDETSQFQRARQPRGEGLVIERAPLVTDENRRRHMRVCVHAGQPLLHNVFRRYD
jgi:hypothetical protein